MNFIIRSKQFEFFRNILLSPYLLILIVLAHRLFLLKYLPFSGDESYHWEWSRNLALSYYDHPPMTAWLISILTYIFGTSRFVVRLTAFLCYSGTLYFIYLLAKDIGGKRVGILSLLILLSVPIISALSVMITTDPPLLFFWAASLYYLYKAIFKNKKFWIISAFCVSGALLSKFLAFNLIFSLLLFLALSGKITETLKCGYFYAFLLLTFILFSPVLYWNYHHDWATFYFNFSKRHTFRFRFKYFFDYVLVQFVTAGITTSALYIAALLGDIKSLSLFKDKKKLYLYTFGIFIFLSFLPVSLSRRIGAHWPICGYLSLTIVASLWLSKINKKIISFIIIFFPLFLTILLSFFLLFPYYLPENISYKGQEKATTKRLVHFYGWEEAAVKLNEYLDEMPDDAKIISDSYGVASLMALYSERNVSSHVLNLYGIHGLNYYFWDTFERTKGISGIYVIATKNLNPNFPKKSIKHLERAFERFEILPHLKIYVNGKHVRNFLFARCFNLVKPLTNNNPI
jgi:4-amino-4-deoxy-L-arabinose transferase-like glycosyltransferase